MVHTLPSTEIEVTLLFLHWAAMMRMALFFLLQHLQAPSVCGMAIPIVVLVAYVGKIMSV